MGKVSGNWITGAHSGRACSQDNIYTKVNKKTGACYSVKLCNPNHESNAKQQKTQSAFGLVSKAVSQWIKDNKVSTGSAYEDYKKVKKSYDAQSKYSTLRGYMITKGMYSVSADKLTVTVDITKRTDFKTAFGIMDSADDNADDNANVNDNPNQQQNQQQNATKYTVTLAASPSEGGTVSGGGQVDAGGTANISAVANQGYTFSGWDDGVNTANRTLPVNSDISLTANFTQDSNPDVNAGGGDDDTYQGPPLE